jgi:hypothetical protein
VCARVRRIRPVAVARSCLCCRHPSSVIRRRGRRRSRSRSRSRSHRARPPVRSISAQPTQLRPRSSNRIPLSVPNSPKPAVHAVHPLCLPTQPSASLAVHSLIFKRGNTHRQQVRIQKPLSRRSGVVRCLRVARPLLDVGKPSLGLEHLSRGGLGKRGLAEGGLHVCDGGSGRRGLELGRNAFAETTGSA